MFETRLFVTTTWKVEKYRKENPVVHFFERFESGRVFCISQINRLLGGVWFRKMAVLQMAQKNGRMICSLYGGDAII